jgi:predicted dehydrogenase
VPSRDAAKAAGFAEQHAIRASTDDYAAILADSSIDAGYLATPLHDAPRMTYDAPHVSQVDEVQPRVPAPPR